MADDADLWHSRAPRWLPHPPVDSIDDACRYLEDVGLALLFPAVRIEAPSL